MGHDQDREARLEQDPLQPLDPAQVEVVGRLVHEDHVGVLHEDLRDRQPLAPAARELAGGLGEVREADLAEDDPGVDQARLLVAAFGHLGHHGLDAGLGREALLLGQVGQLGPAGEGHVPPVGAELAGQEAQQGRLPRAVGADQADPLTRLDREGQAFEEGVPFVGVGQVTAAEQTHEGRSIGAARPRAARERRSAT